MVANFEKAGVCGSRIEQFQRRLADETPAARSGGWINASLISTDRNASCRNLFARRLQTRRCELRRQSTEIRKARNESEKIRRVSRRIMEANDLFGRKFVNRSNFFEVGAKLAAITDRNFAQTRFGGSYLAEAPKVRPQQGFDFCVVELHRIELHKHGCVSGMKIYDALKRLAFQQFKQGNDFAVSIERNFLAKMNEERLVASDLKPNICGKQILHRGESIAHSIIKTVHRRISAKVKPKQLQCWP